MPRKNVIRSLKLNEISGVDNPAQEGARAAIMKRADPRQKWFSFETDGDVQKGYGDLADLLTSENDGHQHGITVDRRSDGISFDISYAKGPEDESGHYHPIARDAQGQYELGVVSGHTHAIDQELMGRVILALVTKDKGAPTMEHTKETLEAALKAANAVIALTLDERQYFNGLDDADAQKKFLAKSADDRKTVIEAATKAKKRIPIPWSTRPAMASRSASRRACLSSPH